MRKLATILLSTIFIIAALALVILLNFQNTIRDGGKIKNYIEESSGYSTLSLYVAEDVADKNQVPIEQGQNLEILNQSYSADNIKPMIDSAVDKVELALRKPTDQNLNINLAYNPGAISTLSLANSSFERNLDLRQSHLFGILVNLPKYLIFLSCLCLILLISIAFLTQAKSWADSIKLLGTLLFCIASLLGAVAICLWQILPNFSNQIVNYFDFAYDQKLINTAEKVAVLAVQGQFVLYIVEICVLILVALALRYLSHSSVKEKISKISDLF
ncbi:MAG: hypothetical protein NTW50_01020 [Candidatus Berkelbacteria bacterium]|nr:hypothetical protein [Candidatus Berkelbacteria bacterium]